MAIKNWEYAGGALLLFGINTIFIALATFLVLKLLRFPMVRYANSKRRKRIAQLVSVVALAVMIPAGYIFYNVYTESRYMKDAQELINKTIGIYQFKSGGRYLDDLTKINYVRDGSSTIELVCMGDELIPESVINTWLVQKNDYGWLDNTELKVVQAGRDDSEEKFNYVSELYESKKAELLGKDERIKVLESEVARLGKLTSKQIPFADISAEAKVNNEDLISLGFAYIVKTDFSKLDTVPTFEAKWKEGLDDKTIIAAQKKLNDWLKIRLKDPKIQLKEAE